MVSANEQQIGGDHYKKEVGLCPHCYGPLEHWDIAWSFRFNCFQYIITKWIWRKKGPQGRPLLQDLEKILHATQKYIEVIKNEEDRAIHEPEFYEFGKKDGEDEGAGPGYVNQDR